MSEPRRWPTGRDVPENAYFRVVDDPEAVWVRRGNLASRVDAAGTRVLHYFVEDSGGAVEELNPPHEHDWRPVVSECAGCGEMRQH